jgi:REP element-mobilizing transposase RayT
VCSYVTSTIIDFVMVFSQPANANLMAGSLLSDLRFYRAELYAFVVMGHHFHFLVVPPEHMTMSQLMDRLKSNAAKRLVPIFQIS